MDNKIADLEEFKSVDQLKREITALKRENNAAMLTIDKLLKDLNKKAEQIKHLESLVTQTVPVVAESSKSVSKLVSPVTAEEEIAETQLERLRLAAKSRTLTLEEIRAYDLLVKNKRLSQDESTINLSKAHYRDVSNDDLLQIVGNNEPDKT